MIHLFHKKNSFWRKIHPDFAMLYLGLILSAVSFYLFSSQPGLQIIVVLATGLYYVLWGIIHHAREGDFHISIFLEYFLIASLAVSVLLTLIVRT